MYIAPNSEVRILNNVRIDNTYENTIYFGIPEAQETYFKSKTKYTLTEQYYVRIENGIIKVELSIANIIDCNYMMFKNTSFENKWFYAFINKVEYVNNVTTRIYFTIDVIQTWFFNYTLRPSLVEREHVIDDTIGLNVTPEPFEINDFVYQDFNELTKSSYNNIDLDTLVIIVAYAKNAQPLAHIDPYNMYDNILQGVDLYAIECSSGTNSGAETLAKLFVDNASTIDNIVDIYVVPYYALPVGTLLMRGYTSLSDQYIIPSQSIGRHDIITFDKIMSGDAFIDPKTPDYTPINNKLYTHPYCMLEVSTPNGEKATYAFEDFKRYDSEFNPDTQIHFAIKGTITTPVQLSCYPVNYKRFITGQSAEALNEPPMTIATYPKVAYSSDAYAAWSAQNSVPVLIDTAMNTITGMASGALTTGSGAGALAGGFLSLIESGAKTASEIYRVSNSSDHTRGSVNNGSVLHAQGIYSFYRSVKHIPNEYAKMIDDYFNLYGYSIRELKIPNRNVRKHWTYTKTINCQLYGNCPKDELDNIAEIYNKGIRFWRNGDEIGDYITYARDNSPDII